MSGFDYRRTLSPDFFEENRQPPHSDHRFTLADGRDPRMSLNGEWYFQYAENPASVPRDFQAPETDCRQWDVIRVPGHIQLQGYGRPQYVNSQYPWDGSEDLAVGQTPERWNPVGCYVTYFTLPEWMAGKRILISFQGVESGLAVWCNGRYLGYGEDGFTPSEFELTDALCPGENKLAVQVFQFTSASWCEDQDFFRFSGIFREVYLYAVPEVHIRDLRLTTEIAGDFGSALLRIDAEAVGRGGLSAVLLDGAAVRAEGKGALGEPVTLAVSAPRLWSAETPFLYRLVLTVTDGQGRVTETVEEQVGFRRFEIRNGIMELNGKRILLRGVNRHEFSARNGRCVTEAETEQDIITMKRHNINAIRTSHYPNQTHLYRLCDRYGIYVMDEMNMESHGAWEMQMMGRIGLEELVPGDLPQWRAMALSRAEALCRRDRNHPCVLIWSCGNESYGGSNFRAVSDCFRGLDSRPVHYEGATMDRRYPGTSDIFSNMYWPAERIRRELEADSSRPALSCEYGHAMGSSFGNQGRYIRLANEMPAYQGGFIWDYIDQTLTRTDRYGREFQGYGGDFDDRPHDGSFCGDGLVYGDDRSPTPKLQEVKYLYQNLDVAVADGRVTVTNRYLFTSTESFVCRESLYRRGRLVEERDLNVCVSPGETGTYPLPLWPETLDDAYSVLVSFRLREDRPWAEAGHEVAFGQWIGGRIPALSHPDRGPEVVDGAWNVGVRGEGFQILFSKSQGGMVSYRCGGRELLKSIPRPNFWRAPTDNDMGSFAPIRLGQWKLASEYGAARGVWDTLLQEGEAPGWCLERGENWAEMTYTYLLPTTPRANCRLSYRVYGDGAVETSLTCDAPEALGPMPELGMLWKMDADFSRLTWYGLGPEATYCDRREGGKLGIYRVRAADAMPRYLRPQECGSRAGVRWASVTDDTGLGLEFFAGEAGEMEFSALPYTPFELENAAHPHELPPVHYTVVRPAMMRMGLAGDDSWGAMPAPEHMLKPGRNVFRFTFRAVGPESKGTAVGQPS